MALMVEFRLFLFLKDSEALDVMGGLCPNPNPASGFASFDYRSSRKRSRSRADAREILSARSSRDSLTTLLFQISPGHTACGAVIQTYSFILDIFQFKSTVSTLSLL